MSKPVLLFISVTLFLAGCDYTPNSRPEQVSSVSEKPDPETWVTHPTDSWPQIVLTNRAKFHEHTPLKGASAFLIKTDDGRILGATAKHLLGSAGGVKPEISLGDFNQVLKSWILYPRTMPDNFVEVDALGTDTMVDPDCDWLILKLKKTAKTLPALPLRIRTDPVKVGESVYLIGCPYSEPDCIQNVYKGKVTQRDYGTRFRYDIDPPVQLPGFSGAPIIDGDGFVVGVMTVWFDPKMDGDKYLEGGGEDIATVFDNLER